MPRSPRPGGDTRLRGATALLVVALCATPLAAWGPSTQVSIARTGAQLAPPDLERQLVHRADKFREGVLAPFQEGEPERHYRNRDRGKLDTTLEAEVTAAIVALKKPASFDEVVERLGRIAHWIGDANNPLNAAGDDPQEGRYFADW